MVICAVIGCSNRSGRDSAKGVSFYKLPKVTDYQGQRDRELRQKRLDGFLAAISREDIDPTTTEEHDYRVCSRHFRSGKPAPLYCTNDPDWLPTLNMGHSKQATVSVSMHVERYERLVQREKRKREFEEMLKVVPSIVSQLIDDMVTEETGLIASQEIEIGKQYVKVGVKEPAKCDCASKVESLQRELAFYKDKVDTLTKQLDDHLPPFCEKTFISDEYTLLHTGLPNFKLLKAIFDHVAKGLPADGASKLSHFQEFMCVMLKLRMNLPNEFMSFLFHVSPATMSRIILKWLKRMDMRLSDLIRWPERGALRKTMPECFKEAFGSKVAVIIDCFEIFIERPSNLLARAATWSNYKHHNTCKVLIGITPQGTISFVSVCWGGRVSDKLLTENSGLLQKLLPGDIVLADRGFDIAESVGTTQARLHIPAFTKGKNQLTAAEVEETRSIANVRIHVERVIGCVRQKFTILESTIPITFLIRRKGEDVPLIDHIVRVCCALTNVCDSVVPFE